MLFFHDTTLSSCAEKFSIYQIRIILALFPGRKPRHRDKK
jgi:hypothetical protein